MNSLERIASTIKFKDTDRMPVVAQVFGHAVTLSGVPVDEYVRNGETPVERAETLRLRCSLLGDGRQRGDRGHQLCFTIANFNLYAQALHGLNRTFQIRHK